MIAAPGRRLVALGLAAACARPTEPPSEPPVVDSDPPAVDTTPPVDPPPQDTAPPVVVDARAEVTPGPTCVDPGARATLGPFALLEGGGDWANQPFDPSNEELFAGGGLAVGDVDGDGRLDVLLPGAGLYLQTAPLTFTATNEGLPAESRPQPTGAALADLDDDGDLDLVVGHYRASDTLWRNDGGGRFVDASPALQRSPDLRTSSPAAGDVDGDGDLDLIIAGFGAFFANPRPVGDPSLLWRNDGDLVFTDASDRLPAPSHDGYTFNAAFVDLLGDGFPELYFVNDFGQTHPNNLVWNEGGVLRMDEGLAGLDVAVQGMGLDWGDLDGDGGTDFVIAGWANHRLLVDHGGVWYREQQARGLAPDPQRSQVIGWSTVFGDLDNDGDLDLAQGYGHVYNQETPAGQPDEIYRNDAGLLVPVGAQWGFNHPGQTRAVLAVDLNGDGWLDLVRRDLTGPATVHLARCADAGAWLVVRPRQPGRANRFAVGARVEARANGRVWWRDVTAGGTAVLAGGPPEVHLGLGEVDVVSLRVRWPDGTWSEVGEVETRAHVVVERQPERAP